MKGILLAGGSGTRLYPATIAVCKQLIPVYDKPMVYYPLSTLLTAGISDILIISTSEDLPRLQKLLGDGSNLGITLQYAVQEKPRGIAEALIIADRYFPNENIALVLGDNIFFGDYFTSVLQSAVQSFEKGAFLFGFYVKEPHRYGVLGFDERGFVTSIEEKPTIPKSSYAISGLYLYDHLASSIAKTLQPSARGELEITDVNKAYLQKDKLKVELFSKGSAWLDAGTIDALQKASIFIQTVEERQGIKIGCIEEIAYRNSWISSLQLQLLAKKYSNNYGTYLTEIATAEKCLKVF